jgi:mannose-6-phosphate isomerase class I
LKSSRTLAEAALGGDERVLRALLSRPLVVDRKNFVERPWGGTRIRMHKGLHPLPEQAGTTGQGIGEAFEIAAFDQDEEACRYPSHVVFDDGSRLSLPRLLEQHGVRILGERFVGRYGACLPLLPKTLDIGELLSVQGHPPGHTEAYIILDAEPGATLAVGFRDDMDSAQLERRLTRGLRQQQALLRLLAPAADLSALHRLLAPWFAAREDDIESIVSTLARFVAGAGQITEATRLLAALKTSYWQMLDSLNAIEAIPGRVIYNATPPRLLAGGQVPSAEVHALGNPEGREVIALEIRLPGPTFRAWDNVRFPQRDVDVATAIASLGLRGTTPEDFIREEVPDPERPGVTCSVDSEFFRVEHYRPGPRAAMPLRGNEPSCLLVIAGETVVRDTDGRAIAKLGRGEAALVPVGLGHCYLDAEEEDTHIVGVTLPCD